MTRSTASTTDELSDDDRRRIRLRQFLDRRFLLVIGVLLATVMAGGWLAYEPHVDPALTEEEQTIDTWVEQPTLSHQAEVQRPNPVFSDGEVLRNQPLYYTRISPTLEGTYAYAYDAPDGEFDVDVDMSLLLQSVDDDGNAYWSEREPLRQDAVEGLKPGQEMQLSFDVNVSDVESRIEAIENSLGASPGTSEATVVVTTRVAGTVNDEPVSNRHTAAYVLETGGSTYGVETDTENVGEHAFTESFEVEQRYGPLRSYGSLGLMLFGLVGIATLGYGRHTGWITVTNEERQLFEAVSQREAFDDWISTGRVGEADLEGPRIDIDSLEGIVDVAIDSDRRVIEDRRRGAYYVVEGDVYHVHEPDWRETSGGDIEDTPSRETAPSTESERAGETGTAIQDERLELLVDSVPGDGSGGQMLFQDDTVDRHDEATDSDDWADSIATVGDEDRDGAHRSDTEVPDDNVGTTETTVEAGDSDEPVNDGEPLE
ncbi:DUF5305 domain-containing protein [Natronosalvus vescus]|uniref:DUF5305 domain-containing protein n=1 Tax=Natronosalvus vescus TaxID=2953881 RepID=UPI0020901E1B|nr:DUF5305 domain-containing protein [Natronosalvus vescus]